MLWEHVPAKVCSLWRLHNRKRGTYLVTMTQSSASELTLVAALGCLGGGVGHRSLRRWWPVGGGSTPSILCAHSASAPWAPSSTHTRACPTAVR